MRHILKDFYVKDIETLRPQAEDKWIFDLDALRDTARKVGFTNVSAADDGAVARLIPAVKYTLMGVLKDQAVIRRYNAIFETFAATVAKGLPQILTSPMVFFVFGK